MESGAHGCADAALDLYEELLVPSSLDDIRRVLGLRGGWGLFSAALTIWLCIRRRLFGLSIESAWASCSASEALRLSPKSSRAQKGELSDHQSGFDYARHHIPLALVAAASDHLYAEAQTLLGSDVSGWYLLDGSSLTLEGTPELIKAFPPATKQGKKLHWPILKLALVHDLQSGLAMRPEWGPMHGPNAVSEQALAHRLIERLPKGCGVIADRNFGILQIAWALHGHRMLIRLTDIRAKAMLKGKATIDQDVDVPFNWKPSAWEKSHHKEFSKEMNVPGRIVVRHVMGPKAKIVRVCLFTNDLESSPEDLTLLYTKRWNIETDLRSLKQTVNLEMVGARSPDMVAKELILSVAAYNIVRTIMAQAAQLKGIQPRKISFARAKGCILVYAARGVPTEKATQQMLKAIAGKPIPNRKTKRSFPRSVWKKGNDFPARKVEAAP